MAVVKKNALAPTDGIDSIPSYLLDKEGGRGVSTDPKDSLVPMATVLQALSPQVDRRGPNYVPGAEAGSIYFKNFDPPIIDGEGGMIFQPCHFQHAWVEWIPRDSGGGFVARHKDCPKDIKRIEDGRRQRLLMPNGNEIVETRYHIGYATLDFGVMPFVIPFTSSGHTVSRGWVTLMNAVRRPDGKAFDSFARLYRLKTVQKSNANGTWFQWSVSNHGWASEEQVLKGEALYNSLDAGEKAIDEDTDTGAAAPF